MSAFRYTVLPLRDSETPYWGDAPIYAGNSRDAAKRAACASAHEFPYGACIVDNDLRTIDLGDEIIPMGGAA